jgi:enoyl-CoA hydratase/carnithine racemase
VSVPEQFVRLEVAADGIATVTIDRPARRNALNMTVKRQLADAVARCSADPAVRVVVLTGAGGFFVAGTDIVEMEAMRPGDHLEQETDRVFIVLRQCPKILVAAVEGYALGGGCELALCCDMIVAGAGARLGQPEIRVGIMPGAGGTQRLVRVMGRYRAMKLILTGAPILAEEALSLGMVSEVVPAGTALTRATELARDVAGMPPLAVRAIKEVVALGTDVPLDTALALERKAFMLLFDTQDQQEGMRAFLEKRRPVFEGR